jgi:hypothetical protein
MVRTPLRSPTTDVAYCQLSSHGNQPLVSWHFFLLAPQASAPISADYCLLQKAQNAFKQHIPGVPLLLVADEVSLETEKKALAHGVGAVFPKQDDLAALAQECSGAL